MTIILRLESPPCEERLRATAQGPLGFHSLPGAGFSEAPSAFSHLCRLVYERTGGRSVLSWAQVPLSFLFSATAPRRRLICLLSVSPTSVRLSGEQGPLTPCSQRRPQHTATVCLILNRHDFPVGLAVTDTTLQGRRPRWRTEGKQPSVHSDSTFCQQYVDGYEHSTSPPAWSPKSSPSGHLHP